MDQDLLKQLILLRRDLHSHPELPGGERQTAQRIVEFVSRYNPDTIVENIGSCGLAFVFNGETDGPVTMIRSELDALPIQELNDCAWRSDLPEVSHKCGHDGHMVMLAGLAAFLRENKPKRGKVILMFQPEEETGTGALKMLADEKFRALKPDRIFALHNIPNLPFGEIHCKDGVFAAASVGMIVRIHGKTSHAAQPEKGRSPSLVVASILQMLETLIRRVSLQDFALITPVYTHMGEKAFGTSPGYAEIMATLRAFKNIDLQRIKQLAKQKSLNIARPFGLKVDVEWVEEFSTSDNHHDAVNFVRNAARDNGLNYVPMKTANRWSEDFGYFLQEYPGAIFGVGSGENMPALHNPDYDFPDALIPYGLKMFKSIIQQINY